MSGAGGAQSGCWSYPGSGDSILYGTAQYAFGNLTGVVFSLTPPSGEGWTYQVIHSFSGGDGGDPEGELILTPNGYLVGTTATGGSYGGGVVFELQPPGSQGADWTYLVLHSFNPATDGQEPYGPLTMDEKGRIYGATEGGGTPGTIFELRAARTGFGIST